MDYKMDAAVRVIVKERDRRRATERDTTAADWMRSHAGHYADGLDFALAAIAGAHGYGWRESLEAALTSPDPFRTGDPDAAAEARDDGAWDAEHDAELRRQQAEPDTKAEPMGGWEPRS